jgi:hypothetical protein
MEIDKTLSELSFWQPFFAVRARVAALRKYVASECAVLCTTGIFLLFPGLPGLK